MPSKDSPHAHYIFVLFTTVFYLSVTKLVIQLNKNKETPIFAFTIEAHKQLCKYEQIPNRQSTSMQNVRWKQNREH